MSGIVTRAAVIIGVNRTGGLPPLSAAVSGAEQVGAWLASEDFDAKIFVDAAGPVEAAAVKRAVRDLVDRSTLEQIVIYFAGHGYLNGSSEVWLLSSAPDDPDEAIDQTESAELARECGIRSVVFISDACRSTPQSLGASRVRGVSIFPNRPGTTVDVEVDRFFAARPGTVAYEVPVERAQKSHVGLFTELLRRVHVDPDENLMRTVETDGRKIAVVPTRRLKDVLPERVSSEAQARSINLIQVPQLRLECGEGAYIARATYSGHAAEPPGLPRHTIGSERGASLEDVARAALEQATRTAERPRGTGLVLRRGLRRGGGLAGCGSLLSR